MKTSRLSNLVSGNASVLLIITVLGSAVPFAYGQAGALDASYLPNPSSIVTAVAIQPDGKALIGGSFGTVDGYERRFVARLNTNGMVDRDFVPATIEYGEVRNLALQPDGKVLIGGQFSRVGDMFTSQVARLHPDGAVDTTFSSALNSYAYFRAIARQTDGKVLVATDDGLDRLLADGSRDTNFQRFAAFQWITNGDGMTSANNSLRAVAELSDGKILVGGDLQAIAGLALGAGVIRLNVDGSWDASFQRFTNGVASALLVQPDGKIVVGRNGRLARLNADGTVDDSFAAQSIEGDVMSLARQPDGKILVGGYYQRAAGRLRPGIARFNADGTLDRNFDAGDVNGFTVASVALQADAKLLIGGYFTSVDGQNRPYVARLHNDHPNFPGRFEFLSASNAVAEAAGNLVIPVIRYAGSAGTASVVVATGWGSALPGEDYLSRTQTLVFLPGQTSNNFNVPILNDGLVEGPYAWEGFEVQLSAPSAGAALGSERRAGGYILEDDTAIGFASTGMLVEEAAGQVSIPVVRLGVANAAISALFQTQNGTAVAPGDFTAQSGTIAFAPGETNQIIVVPLNDDALVEGQETFTVRLSAPTGGATLATSDLTVYVSDDVSFLAFTTNPIVTETDGQVTLKVRRWGRTNNTVSVRLATSNLTALAGSDYTASSGTLSLSAGEVESTITVPILDDATVEDQEQFQVTLSQATGALVLDGWVTSTVTLISDDGAGYPDTHFRPVVPGGRVLQMALAPGGKILVRGDQVRTNGTPRPTLLRFNPDGSTDPSFQSELSDEVYWIAASPEGKVYVCSGYGVQTSVRRLLADGQPDWDFDSFFVNYTGLGNAGFSAMAVQADGKLIISAYPAPYYAYERTTNYLNRLNVDGSYDLAFGPVSELGSEKLAVPPSALALQPDGKLLLAATFIATNGSSLNRVVRLTDSGQLDATFSPPPEVNGNVWGICPLANGEVLIHGSFTAINGLPRLGMAIFRADGALSPAFIPGFQASDYFRNTITAVAIQGDGKVVFSGDARLPGGAALSLGRLNTDGSLDSSFHASNGSIHLWLALQADGKVLVDGSTGPFFGAQLERVNNDPNVGAGFVEFSAASLVVNEANASVTLGARRVGGTNGLVRVRYATQAGTATDASDFVAQTGILEFTPGDASEKAITISLLDDALAESDETFLLSLGAPVGGAIWGGNAATGITVRDNDTTLEFLGTRFSIRESAGAQDINVRRLGGTTGVVSVDYATSDGTSQAGLDYLAQSGTLTFANGETNKVITVPVYDDTLSERDETVNLTLSHPTGGALLGTNAAAVITIVDSDRPGTLDPSFNPGTGFCSSFSGFGDVRAVALQSDGKLLVGGNFSSFNGVACPGLVRLQPNGAVDPAFTAVFPVTMPGPPVARLALQPDGKVLVVGADYSSGGRLFLARLNPSGSFDPSFGVVGVGGEGWIEALFLQSDGRVLIGGEFDSVRGVARTNLARITADGLVDPDFAPIITWPFGSGLITAMAQEVNGRILIGGVFNRVNGVTRHNLARLEITGSLDLTFAAFGFTNAIPDDANDSLHSIAVQPDGQILVGGALSQSNGQIRPILARLNPNGSLDSNFSVVLANDWGNFMPHVSVVLCQPDRKLLVGGGFTSVNGVLRQNLARLNSDGSLDLSFQSGEVESEYDPYATDIVLALAVQQDGQLLVGGSFHVLDGQSRCGLARLNGVQLRLGAVSRGADGQWRIQFSGTAGDHYSVLESSNLLHWEFVGAAVETSPGSFEFSDPGSGNQPCRFYRLRSP